MDGCPRQDPAYRPATERAPATGPSLVRPHVARGRPPPVASPDQLADRDQGALIAGSGGGSGGCGAVPRRAWAAPAAAALALLAPAPPAGAVVGTELVSRADGRAGAPSNASTDAATVPAVSRGGRFV